MQAARSPSAARATARLIIAGRLLLLLLAAGATVFAFGQSWARDRQTTIARERYVCPMHPEVSATAPSECPICRMALEPVRPAPAHSLPATPSQSVSVEESSGLEEYNVIGAAERRSFTLEVCAPAWLENDLVTAVLYKHDLVGLDENDPALFFHASIASVGVNVRRTGEPPEAWDASTLRVNFRIDPGARAGQPARAGRAPVAREAGWLKLPARSREVLVVPSGAVLQSPEGPYVLAAEADGRTFSKRRVEIGRVLRGLTVVSSGLHADEAIAVGSAFSLNAEQRLLSDGQQAIAVLP